MTMPSRVLIITPDHRRRHRGNTNLASMLRLEEHEVRTALDAETGLQQARTEQPDSIIVDLRMPLVNGLGFLYRLRADQRYHDTPVAIVTGDYSLDDGISRQLDELGAEPPVKPLWLEDLVDLTHSLLGTVRGGRTPGSRVAHLG